MTAKRSLLGTIATYLVLITASPLTLVPFLLSLNVSLLEKKALNKGGPFTPAIPPTFEHYQDLFGRRVDFGEAIWTTVAVVAIVLVCQLLFSVLAAYAFAKLRFPGRDILFWVFLATLMVPQAVTVLPLYFMLSEMGLRATFWGLVLPYLFGSPYAIFLLRESFRQVPDELIDAMRMDGAGHLRILFGLVLPLNRPIMVTLALITVVSHWNNFMWPRIIGGNKVHVLTTATASLQEQYSNNVTLVMAASTIALIPLIALFLAFQQQIVRSITITSFR
ncbi:carbohydrate ABC transporter permease [Pseudoclavibacter albus]|uniref:carbohydrate ABC transporter permease n=1 Tax=Pseudoclavibacter albus TaxID=272241 RepID=UPI00082643CA|nr:carbohydrate ABC transporter permease [Pseudoclavibacter alba]